MLGIEGIRWLALGVAALALAGCGGGDDDDDDDQCTPPTIKGTPFFASGSGLGKAHGHGQLPAGVKDGQELDLQVASSIGASSVLPDDLFGNSTCGKSFSFQISGLDPDTYHLGYAIYDPNSDSLDALFQATSTNEFTITGNEDVEFNPTF